MNRIQPCPPPCPESETLAAFADGTLEVASREAIEGHLADCGDCRGVVVAAASSEVGAGVDSSSSAGDSAAPELSDRVLARLRAGDPSATGIAGAGSEGNVRRST